MRRGVQIFWKHYFRDHQHQITSSSLLLSIANAIANTLRRLAPRPKAQGADYNRMGEHYAPGYTTISYTISGA
jgi:hypothetical protein